jgi:D-alanyl-D-alanine carboxypeptidase (penicillin-binding protein 5/6)
MKTVRILVASTLLLPFLPSAGAAKRMPPRASAAIVVNAADGHVLYEQNADMPIPPASITKILTLYLVYEAIHEGRAHPWSMVPISTSAATTGGTRMLIRAGTQVPLQELIKGMAVDSGNDACVAAAEHVAGSVAEFVARMNHRAAELGMTHSHFENPHGLPAGGQFTTARDMARLSLAYLRRFPESLDIHSMRCYTYNRVTQVNRNRLLGSCPGVDGIKTGWIVASGYNLVATAKRGDARLITVVMGAPTPAARLEQSRSLIEAGFQAFAAGAPAIDGTHLAAVPPAEATIASAGSKISSSRKLAAVKASGGKVAPTAQRPAAGRTPPAAAKTGVAAVGSVPSAQGGRISPSPQAGKTLSLTASRPAAGNREQGAKGAASQARRSTGRKGEEAVQKLPASFRPVKIVDTAPARTDKVGIPKKLSEDAAKSKGKS